MKKTILRSISAKSVLLTIAAALLLCCCHNKEARPEGVLDEETYVELLTDLYLAEGYFTTVSNYQFDNYLPEIVGTYDSIMARHGATPEQLTATEEYYMERKEKSKSIYERVMKNIEDFGSEEAVKD